MVIGAGCDKQFTIGTEGHIDQIDVGRGKRRETFGCVGPNTNNCIATTLCRD